MTAWPDLPCPLMAGFQESPPSNTIRTSMDSGTFKVRRRSTSAPRNVAFSLLLTKAQVETLDEFFTDTVSSGAISFDWTHPRTLASVTARFLSPPQYTPASGKYVAAVSLEILP